MKADCLLARGVRGNFPATLHLSSYSDGFVRIDCDEPIERGWLHLPEPFPSEKLHFWGPGPRIELSLLDLQRVKLDWR